MNFMKVISAWFSNTSRDLWRGKQTFGRASPALVALQHLADFTCKKGLGKKTTETQSESYMPKPPCVISGCFFLEQLSEASTINTSPSYPALNIFVIGHCSCSAVYSNKGN